MTIKITLSNGITMKVEDVEEYSLIAGGITVKKKGFAPHTIFGSGLCVERIK